MNIFLRLGLASLIIVEVAVLATQVGWVLAAVAGLGGLWLGAGLGYVLRRRLDPS